MQVLQLVRRKTFAAGAISQYALTMEKLSRSADTAARTGITMDVRRRTFLAFVVDAQPIRKVTRRVLVQLPQANQNLLLQKLLLLKRNLDLCYGRDTLAEYA